MIKKGNPFLEEKAASFREKIVKSILNLGLL